MKKKWVILFWVMTLILLIGILACVEIQKTHTFTLANQDGTTLQSEQIQPLFGTVKVSSDCDTSVVFTDIETGKTYTIKLLTTGMSGKVKLERGRWYTVEGNGTLTVSLVNVRVE